MAYMSVISVWQRNIYTIIGCIIRGWSSKLLHVFLNPLWRKKKHVAPIIKNTRELLIHPNTSDRRSGLTQSCHARLKLLLSNSLSNRILNNNRSPN